MQHTPDVNVLKPGDFEEARKALGLTQAELEAALGLSPAGGRTVRRYELGERHVPGPVAILLRYMQRFGISRDARALMKRARGARRISSKSEPSSESHDPPTG